MAYTMGKDGTYRKMTEEEQLAYDIFIAKGRTCPTGNIWCNYKVQCTNCRLGNWYGVA